MKKEKFYKLSHIIKNNDKLYKVFIKPKGYGKLIASKEKEQ